MPYTNVPDDKIEAMDACVQEVQDSEGVDEQTAIAICYKSVVEGMARSDAQAAVMSAPTRGELVALAQPALLADANTLKIQVLRPGAFVDMNGLDVLIEESDLETYVANSNAALERAQLPVEIGHPYDAGAPAAAWYTNFYTDVINGIAWVCADIELTTLGAQALADKLYKYFSGNLDLVAKQICGGGFVNRPAVSGQQPIGALAAPPEYLTPRAADSAHEITPKGGEGTMTEEQMQAQLAAVREEERAKLVAERADWEAKLAAAREDERARVLAEQKRASDIRELSEGLTRGRKALWHKPEELGALLGKLTEDDRVLVGALLKEIQARGLVDLGEHGTQADGSKLAALPQYAARALSQWTEKDGTVAEFFAVNPELGAMDQYDLRAFVKPA